MKYLAKITETLTRYVPIEAKNKDEAEEKIDKQYKNCEIVLDWHDFVDYEIKIEKL